MQFPIDGNLLSLDHVKQRSVFEILHNSLLESTGGKNEVCYKLIIDLLIFKETVVFSPLISSMVFSILKKENIAVQFQRRRDKAVEIWEQLDNELGLIYSFCKVTFAVF